METQGRHWANHVQSYIASARHEIMVVRLLARNGVSEGEATGYAPLSGRDAIEPLLKAFEIKLDELKLALSSGTTSSKAEPESATRFALKIRLGMLADELPVNLLPEEIGKGYGAVPPDVSRTLKAAVPELQKLISQVIAIVERKGTRS